MTREEAINILTYHKSNVPENSLITNALEMAIKALEQEPCDTDNEVHCNCTDKEIAESFISDVEAVKDLLPRAESEPCEDCVSRAWLKGAIHNFYYGLTHAPSEEDIQAYIDAAPSVTPKQKKWRWIAANPMIDTLSRLQ